ncbi:hypothetical protein ACQ0MK_03850 [Thalassospira lucentensis]|uniref:hypothetical protein n=1 Tax=Thalassospira lucentensis TaxID=168935 RepID=UPI003D2EC459
MKKSVRNAVLGLMLVSLTLPIGLSLTHSTAQSAAQTAAQTASWRETKCALYQQHRDETRATMPENTTSALFDDQETAFIASGCTQRSYVCPNSPGELDYANLMAVKLMNEGATGSFLPFACKETGR